MKLLDKILADPRVESLEDEGDCAFGTSRDWWCHLKPGYIDTESDTHSIHEPTLRDVAFRLKHYVQPCQCCVARKA